MEKNRKPAAVKGKDWNEENNIIYFVVVSDGTNGARWFERLQREGDYVTEHAQRLLNSSSFVPSKGGVVMKIAVLRGASFCDADRFVRSNQGPWLGMLDSKPHLLRWPV